METIKQLEALNNALNYFGLKNINLHEKQYSDKRKKVSKFFLRFKTKESQRTLVVG